MSRKFEQSQFIAVEVDVQSDFLANVCLKISELLFSVFKSHENDFCDC